MRFRRRSHEPKPAEPPRPSPPEEAPETDFARRVLAHASSPEEKLERLLAERSQELEEQAARFELAMEDIERREALLRDMRASVERMLRLGATDLDEREAEVEALDRDAAERRERLSAAEAELDRRRRELGAVELKREAVEQRERALAAREEELEAREAGSLTDLRPPAPREETESDAEGDQAVGLLFVPGAAYTLVEVEAQELRRGSVVEVDGVSYVVTKLGPAPLPGDERACAYLERVVPGSSAADGSS
jgi:chromosome segregation ATPase